MDQWWERLYDSWPEAMKGAFWLTVAVLCIASVVFIGFWAAMLDTHATLRQLIGLSGR